MVAAVLSTCVTNTSGSLWHDLVSVRVVVVALREVVALRLVSMLVLIVRSGSRSGRRLGLGAKTRKHVNTARARSWVKVGLVLADGVDLGIKGKTQALCIVSALVARCEAGTRNAEAIGREAVKSHVSKTTSVHGSGYYSRKLG